MIREQGTGLGTLAVLVLDCVLDVRMRAAEKSHDALVLVDQPAFDADLAELGAGHAQWVFQCAEEGRVGQGVEGDG